jgi:tetratricopeptide (TPR) repeat protein
MRPVFRENAWPLRCFFAAAVLASIGLGTAGGQSADQLYKDAIAADERGDFSRAVSLYERVIRLRPDSVPARTNLGAALVHLGRYEEAITQYQETLKHDPRNSIVHLDLDLAWYKQAEYEKAVSELELLRKEKPNDPQSLYLLADCYLRLGRNSDVVTLLSPAYQVNPEDRAVDYALGTALIREGRIQQGEGVIDHVLKDGDTGVASLLLGEVQLAAGDYQTAAATLRRAVDLEPKLAEGWSLYGRALLDADDISGARTAFQRALDADPHDFVANLHLGAVLRRQGNSKDAAAYLGRALQLRPGSAEALFQIGALKASTGKLDEARRPAIPPPSAWIRGATAHKVNGQRT